MDKVFYKVDKARNKRVRWKRYRFVNRKGNNGINESKCGVLNHEDGVEFWFELDIEN